MLKRLIVRNLAVVEEAEVEFDPGLTVITGETGAGKSVLMGALDLVLGGRAEASIVRQGAKEAEVEATFDTRVIRRTVTHEGRSRAWVNDESVSIAELKELGATLVDIHGPTANQRLLAEAFQREVLDAFGKTARPLRAYAAVWKEYAALRGEIAALESVGGEGELDLLRYQVNELAGADLTEEDATLGERHAAAAHAEEIIAGANAITEGLGGDRGALDVMSQLQPRFHALSRHLPVAQAWAQEAEGISVRIQELSRTVADAVSRLDCGAEDLSALDSRLTVVNRLLRKYRAEDVTRLMDVLAEKKAKLDALENRDVRLEELRGKLAASERAVRAAGEALTKARSQAGEKLGASITKELKGLGFARAKFSIALEPIDPSESGCDRVVYLFEPNPGESVRPLADIASSGEIARVMLAVKTVTARASADSPTLVFDEIDANIGGEIGQVVGEKLRRVASGEQVIAITHLPQSAVFGARHLVVSKEVREGRTRTNISVVSGEARVSEIARMLGGEKITSVVRKHAQELLLLSR